MYLLLIPQEFEQTLTLSNDCLLFSPNYSVSTFFLDLNGFIGWSSYISAYKSFYCACLCSSQSTYCPICPISYNSILDLNPQICLASWERHSSPLLWWGEGGFPAEAPVSILKKEFVQTVGTHLGKPLLTARSKRQGSDECCSLGPASAIKLVFWNLNVWVS